jgi:hypothetical protein
MMAEKRKKYDIVIRHRLDVDARFKILPQYKDGVVIGCRKKPRFNAMCDCHAYGCMRAMKTYCNLYPIADNILKPKICGHKGRGGRIVLSPEMATREALKTTKVYKDDNYKRTIHRMNGTFRSL